MIKRAAFVAAILLAGCEAPTPPEPPKPAPQVAPAQPPISLDGYKRDIAGRFLNANRAITYEGTPPHLLRAVVVLELTIDGTGAVRGLRTLRAPDEALAAVAMRSVRAAGPLPAPPPQLLQRGELRLVETWLFRDDGRFQVRSLAAPQARLAEEPAVRTR